MHVAAAAGDHALELTAPAEVAAGTEERLRRVDVARLPRRLQREKHFLDACEEGTSVEGRIGGAEFGETFFGAQHLSAPPAPPQNAVRSTAVTVQSNPPVLMTLPQ